MTKQDKLELSFDWSHTVVIGTWKSRLFRHGDRFARICYVKFSTVSIDRCFFLLACFFWTRKNEHDLVRKTWKLFISSESGHTWTSSVLNSWIYNPILWNNYNSYMFWIRLSKPIKFIALSSGIAFLSFVLYNYLHHLSDFTKSNQTKSANNNCQQSSNTVPDIMNIFSSKSVSHHNNSKLISKPIKSNMTTKTNLFIQHPVHT